MSNQRIAGMQNAVRSKPSTPKPNSKANTGSRAYKDGTVKTIKTGKKKKKKR